jgi:hypothetical protein
MIGRCGKGAQASMEYLIVVGLAFLVMIPSIYFFFNFSKESGQEISLSQIDAIGREIVRTSESILYSGPGSKTTMTIGIPEGVVGASLYDQRELAFNVSTASGDSELVFFSRVNLSIPQGCSLGPCPIDWLGTPGTKQVRLIALNTSVRIEQAG